MFRGDGPSKAVLLEGVEEILIGADLGVEVSQKLLSGLPHRWGSGNGEGLEPIIKWLKGELKQLLIKTGQREPGDDPVPYVIMVVGVNGVGKTTTIGKMAFRSVREGRRVLLVAGDTFRAAAVEQLEIWGKRAGCRVIKGDSGADPASVIYDGLSAGRAQGVDRVIVDTAGRMHTKTSLMEELRKMRRVMEKAIPGSPHEILMVLDATTGRNGLSQARMFHEAVGLTGLVLTKLDGTAKGGVAVAAVDALGIPIRLVGVGEGIEDLEDFSADAYVEGLFGE